MTIEELKKEAKKRGYYLQRIKEPLIDIYPCPICGNEKEGRTKDKIWCQGDIHMWHIHCQRCGYHMEVSVDSSNNSIIVYDYLIGKGRRKSFGYNKLFEFPKFKTLKQCSSNRKRENFIRELWNYKYVGLHNAINTNLKVGGDENDDSDNNHI